MKHPTRGRHSFVKVHAADRPLKSLKTEFYRGGWTFPPGISLLIREMPSPPPPKPIRLVCRYCELAECEFCTGTLNLDSKGRLCSCKSEVHRERARLALWAKALYP